MNRYGGALVSAGMITVAQFTVSLHQTGTKADETRLTGLVRRSKYAEGLRAHANIGLTMIWIFFYKNCRRLKNLMPTPFVVDNLNPCHIETTMKRFFDVVFAGLALALMMPLALLIAAWIKLDSRGPVLARPHRVGRNGRMVKIFEFRTAIADADAMETVGGCHGEEITRAGAVLRRLALARLPILINVLRGDLSLVGPRAELPRYVGCYPTAMRKLVLSVKPGLVDLASIEFRAEPTMLAGLEGEALEETYVDKVLPIKLACAQRYMEGRGLWMDLRIIILFVTFGLIPHKQVV
jgi:lipopolysaccharide/colanic/teichoic acid biosynthesis glycosyltransferase